VYTGLSGVTAGQRLLQAPTATCSALNVCQRAQRSGTPRKAQVTPVLRAHRLFGYVDGSIPAPPMECIEGTDAAVRRIVNPAFLTWYTLDQLVLSSLVASMSEDMLGQMTQHTSSAAV
jgi:hypothetical protein